MPYRKAGRWHRTKAERERGEEYCEIDGNQVQTMTFMGTGVCSDNCRKARDGDDRSTYGRG